MLRAVTAGIFLLLILAACQLLPVPPLTEQLVPAPSLSAGLLASPTATTDKTVCESSADFQAAIDDLRGTDLWGDGVATLLVRIDAAIDEARLLADLAGAELRPTVGALSVSLQGLRTTVRELDEQETLAAGATAVGASLAQIAEAMDALAVQLQTTCP